MTVPSLDFSGRVVIVTGGGRGVGRGISLRFLEAGAEVVICGRKQPEELPAAGGREALFVEADVRDLDHVDRPDPLGQSYGRKLGSGRHQRHDDEHCQANKRKRTARDSAQHLTDFL